MPDAPRTNIRQVAALAGVSHQTVSRVLNDHPNIRPATRERVLKVIQDVDYRPSGAARALATAKSNRIGVLVDSAVEFGPNSTLRGVESAARATGYSVASVTVDGDPTLALGHLMAQDVDALCLIAPRQSSLTSLRDATPRIPTLVVTAAADATFLTASVDQELGASLAVRHLIDLGHRDIAHVAGPLDWLDARGRHRAWESELATAGLDAPRLVVGDWTADFAYDVARRPSAFDDCTAVFAGNDQMALGLVHGFAERGIRVPERMSVVGFDDLPEAKHFLPPLTTVRQDFRLLGERSMDVLLAELEGRDHTRRILIEPQLIVRRSSSPPT